jgi:FtsP/CotA-like multicopper oxidase with cupredoxin domain
VVSLGGPVDRRRFLQGAAVTGVAGALAGSGTTLANASSVASSATVPAPAAAAGTHREFWVQAESFKHNLVPNGRDGMMGMTYKASETTYWAIGFRAYTPNFGKPLPGNADIGPNTGIPGPVFRLNVGDTVTVHFRNNDTHYKWPHSIHPHGVRYAPLSDGAWLAADPNKPGTAVKFGQTYTYTWTVAPSSVGTWPYHDHSMPKALQPGDMPTGEVGALLGLFGMIIVEDPQAPKADVENLVFLHDVYTPTFQQEFNCINGQAFLDNTPTFTA